MRDCDARWKKSARRSCGRGSAWAGSAGLPIVGILFITLAVASFLSVGPITWSYPTAFLTGTAAAAGIGLINSLGNLGGFVAPLMRTGINQAVPTESGVWGIVSLGVFAFLAAGMLFATKFFSAKADALLEAEKKVDVESEAPGL